MKTHNYWLLSASFIMLAACSPDNTQKAKLFEEQRSALDKAKAVEGLVQQQNQDTQKKLEQPNQ